MTVDLVIGYGNTLRSDDGAGQIVANLIADWALETVRSLAVHQLTPELAAEIASSQRVIFVDVYVAPEQPDLQLIELTPMPELPAGLGHTADPRSLLTLAQQLYGATPRSWWVLIPALNFEFGEELSPVTQQGIEQAIAQIQSLLMAASSPNPEPTM